LAYVYKNFQNLWTTGLKCTVTSVNQLAKPCNAGGDSHCKLAKAMTNKQSP